jgi:ATP-binding cassette subfamily F protein 3
MPSVAGGLAARLSGHAAADCARPRVPRPRLQPHRQHRARQQAHAYRGNYSAFETQRAAELAEQAALFTRQQREIKHMESFVERFRAQATKARQAQSRLKALERMQRIAPAHVDSPLSNSLLREPDKAAAAAAGAGDQSCRLYGAAP